MRILTFRSPRAMMDERCYLVFNRPGSPAIVVDPDGVGDAVLRALSENRASLGWILLTHGHFDHIGSVADIKRATGARVAIHGDDAAMLTDARLNLSDYFGMSETQCPADRLLGDGDRIGIGSAAISVLHTPGHTAGSCCFLAGDSLFSGDTLFSGSVGRTDFPGGDAGRLLASIRERLLVLPDGVAVYPGHGNPTAIEREKRRNPYLNEG